MIDFGKYHYLFVAIGLGLAALWIVYCVVKRPPSSKVGFGDFLGFLMLGPFYAPLLEDRRNHVGLRELSAAIHREFAEGL
jgi:hypothetical protein